MTALDDFLASMEQRAEPSQPEPEARKSSALDDFMALTGQAPEPQPQPAAKPPPVLPPSEPDEDDTLDSVDFLSRDFAGQALAPNIGISNREVSGEADVEEFVEAQRENLTNIGSDFLDALSRAGEALPDIANVVQEGAEIGARVEATKLKENLQQGRLGGMGLGPFGMFLDTARDFGQQTLSDLTEGSVPAPQPPSTGESALATPEVRESVADYIKSAEAISKKRPESEGAALVYDIATMAIKMAPSITVGLATKSPNLGLATMFGQVYGEKFGQMVAQGYDAETARLHGLASATIETATEKLPFEILLRRVGWSGVRRLLGFTLAEGLQEGASSGLQSAWDKGTINPDLTLAEALRAIGYETLVGTIGGPVVGGPVVLYQKWQGSKNGRKVIEDLENIDKQFRDVIKSEIERGGIQGPQLPPELRDAAQERQTMDTLIREDAAADPDFSEQTRRVLVNHGIYPEDARNPTIPVVSRSATDVINETYPGLKNTKPGEVKVGSLNHYQIGYNALVQEKQQIEELFDNKVPMTWTQAVKNQDRLTEVNELLPQYQRLAEVEQTYGTRIQAVLENYVQRLMPELRLFVEDKGFSHKVAIPGFEVDGALGRTFQTQDGVHVIEFDIGTMLDKNGNFMPGSLLETITHEFGHAMITQIYKQEPEHVQKAIRGAHAEWLNKQLEEWGDKPLIDYMKSRHGFFFVNKNIFQKDNVKEAVRKQTLREYIGNLFEIKKEENFFAGLSPEEAARAASQAVLYDLGLTEFTAIQTEKILLQKEFADFAGDKETKGFLQRVNRGLRKLYDHYKETWGYSEKYDTFLQLLGSRATYQRAMKAYAAARQEVLDRSYDEVVEDEISSILHALQKGPVNVGPTPPEADPYGPDQLRNDLDRYNNAYKYAATILQLQQENPHIIGLKRYTDVVHKWWNDKMKWTARSNEHLGLWKDLGGKRAKNLGYFLIDLTVASFENKTRYTPESETFQRLANKWGIDEEMLSVWDMIDKDFRAVLQELHDALVADAHRQFGDNAEQLRENLRDIEKTFGELMQLNFFPLSRFGKYFVRVTALETQTRQGKTYKPGDIISFEAHEKPKQQRKSVRQWKRDSAVQVASGFLTDAQRQFAGLPPQLMQMIKRRLGLTPEQIERLPEAERDLAIKQEEELSQLIHDIAPGQSFINHMKHRKNTRGFSMDGQRAYANYFMQFSGYVARAKYKGDLLGAMQDIKDSIQRIQNRGGDTTKRGRILQHVIDHYDYIMNPGPEFANLRALGFLWYLGFVPKSALVNLTQIPLLTYPYLAARYGDATAVSAITKATKDAANYWLRPQALRREQYQMLEELKNRGIIDESMATELAATSEGSLLQRLAPGTFLQSDRAARFIRDWAGKGAWLFQTAEKANRRVTALAAFDLARQNGQSYEQALESAHNALNMTQYEYARWNRPLFARRRRSVFFLFWMYKQNTLYFMLKDPGSKRYLLMMFLMAGLSGLPFAEDLMDLFDWLAKQYNKAFGGGSTPMNIRAEVREISAELGANPDLIMHGLSRESLGMPLLGDLVGVPIPRVDISGSISMGRVVPGVEPVFGREGEFDQRFSKGIEEALGAVPAMGINIARAVADNNPDTIKRWEKALPSVARNIAKAYRFALQGEETLRGGAAIGEFDLTNTMHMAEIIGQSMGFAPTRLQQTKEKYYMTQEIVRYYEHRRRHFMTMLDWARRTGDRELESDIWGEIDKYNKTVPDPTFRLGPQDIKRSLKGRIGRRLKIERGQFVERRGIPTQEKVERGFPTQPEREPDQEKTEAQRFLDSLENP